MRSKIIGSNIAIKYESEVGLQKHSTEILNKLNQKIFKFLVFLHTIFLRSILRYLTI